MGSPYTSTVVCVQVIVIWGGGGKLGGSARSVHGIVHVIMEHTVYDVMEHLHVGIGIVSTLSDCA